MRVRLCNYSQDRKDLLVGMESKLVDVGTVYFNATSPWASAQLSVPNPDLDKFRLTVDLRRVNQYTIVHQFYTSNI